MFEYSPYYLKHIKLSVSISRFLHYQYIRHMLYISFYSSASLIYGLCFHSKFLIKMYYVNQVFVCSLRRESEGRGSQILSKYMISSRTQSQKAMGVKAYLPCSSTVWALEVKINKTYHKDTSFLILSSPTCL